MKAHTAAPVRAFIHWEGVCSGVPKETNMDRCNVNTEAATSAYRMLRMTTDRGEVSQCRTLWTAATVIL